MSFAQIRQGLRADVFATLGEPATLNGATETINVRVRERDDSLAFGDSRINARLVIIEAPTTAGVKAHDRLTLVSDGRTFVVNSAPVVVRSGVHSLSCEVVP